MNNQYKRILLKLSGESLMGEKQYGIDEKRIAEYATQIKEIADMGIEIGIVIGGGNIFRGLSGTSKGVDRVKGDQMGMLATVINSLALSSALEKIGQKAQVFTAINMFPIGEYYSKWRAIEAMQNGTVAIISGGTGNPFFTTDTGSALRGIEIEAEVMLKGTYYCSQHFDRLRIYHADAFGRYRLCLCGPQDTCQIQQIGAVNMSAMTGRVKDADRGEFKKTGQFHEIFRRLRKDRGAMVGLVILIVLIFVIIFADMIVPYQAAISQDVMNNFAAPSAEHFMGTDMYGRDVFARFVHGARTSLAISLFASVTSCVFGSLLGAAAGYFGGKVDMAIMRCLDIFMSVPDILFTMVVVAALGSSIPILIVAMTLAYFTNYVRLVRSEVLNLCEQEYVEAAKAGGASSARIILSHIIPNALGIILVNLTLNVASLVIYQSSLSYIGLSLPQPTPEWGSMLSEAREFMLKAPHLVFFPAAAIVLTAFSVNLLGDGLRDAMDPRLKN